MELVKEEFMRSNDLSQVVKGRRTKRQRSSSPYKAVMTTSSSSSGCGGSDRGEGEEVVVEEFGSVFSSTTTSSDYIYNESTEEEEMANCLILLAQGDASRQVEKTIFSNTSAPMKMEKFTPKKFSDFATSAPTTNKAGFYVYDCKTCNRSFPSFQALGGHRASHKKPKPTNIEEKKLSPNLPLVVASMYDITSIDSSLNKSSLTSPDLITLQIATNNTNPQKGPSQGNNNKVNKVHECSICGSEFNSGQALGGHMRRHRANTGNSNQVAFEANPTTEILAMNDQDHKKIKPRNVLPLDLNLPAPEDDHYHHHHYHHHHQPNFGLASTQQSLVLTAPALVGCHY